MKKNSYITGFTLIELMVTIAVLAVIMSIAIPSMKKSMANQDMKLASGKIYSVLQSARSDSSRKKLDVSINDDKTEWSYNFSSLTGEGNQVARIDDDMTVTFNNLPAAGLQFFKTGRSNVSGKMDINICKANSGVKAYVVTLFASGSSEISRGTTC